ncbi:MAG: hypothetical protein JNM14_04350 [Ferruginibacter sp.]|nr:hypothetical protein [Ferruginibacter sp.]
MKKIIVLCCFLFVKATGLYAQLEASFKNDTIVISRNAENGTILHLPVDITGLNAPGGIANTITFTVNTAASTMPANGYSFSPFAITVVSGVTQVECPVTINRGKNAGGTALFLAVQMSYTNSTGQTKNIVIKVIAEEEKKPQASDNDDDKGKSGRIKDPYNYFKAEVVQYTDIAGIKNDKPNGLLQFQGIIKVPLNHHKTITKGGWFYQGMRAVLFDVLLNRIDKSKEEVDYNYTAYLYQNDTAKKAPRPWLATTDIWRFSNLHVGARLVPFTIGKGDFRVQLQTGVKLIKNQPYSEDTIRSGIDSGKVKADFRSVYSFAKYIELYFKYYNAKEKVEISLNTGFMWLKLLDSYYEQVDIYQQDPFQKAVALSTVNDTKRSKPMYFISVRGGKGLGKEDAVSAFIRLNYTLQSGTYLRPLTTIIDGRPIAFEKKSFYNNFFQVHFGTTFDLDKIFSKKEEEKKKGDGPISNSVQ